MRDNRLKLLPVIKVIVLFEKWNLAWRSHRDDVTDLNTDENHGNLNVLLNEAHFAIQYRIDITERTDCRHRGPDPAED